MNRALAAISENEAARPTPDAIMKLGSAFWGSKTLLSAVELGLFSELAASGPLAAEGLRDRLGLRMGVRGGPPAGANAPSRREERRGSRSHARGFRSSSQRARMVPSRPLQPREAEQPD